MTCAAMMKSGAGDAYAKYLNDRGGKLGSNTIKSDDKLTIVYYLFALLVGENVPLCTDIGADGIKVGEPNVWQLFEENQVGEFAEQREKAEGAIDSLFNRNRAVRALCGGDALAAAPFGLSLTDLQVRAIFIAYVDSSFFAIFDESLLSHSHRDCSKPPSIALSLIRLVRRVTFFCCCLCDSVLLRFSLNETYLQYIQRHVLFSVTRIHLWHLQS